MEYANAVAVCKVIRQGISCLDKTSGGGRKLYRKGE
jgi:hypothetical protein